MTKYNLGCGDDIRDGWVNVDKDPESPADIRYDLEDLPWPWKSRSADTILMDNVFEHIHPRHRAGVINECYRLLDPNGRFIMHLPVPEIGSGWDVTHYNIPSWRWPFHPRWQSEWIATDISISKVGPGRLMPDGIAKLATRFWLVRCIDEVKVVVTPQ